MCILVRVFAAQTSDKFPKHLQRLSAIVQFTPTNTHLPFKTSFIQSYFWLFVLAPFSSIQLHSRTENLSLILSTGVSPETDKCTSLQF